MLKRRNWLYLWNWLIGNRSEFSVENRAFNAISIISLIIMVIILPINTLLGLLPVELTLLVLIALQSVFYYWSRFRKKYVIGMFLYILASYITLILNFFFNSGSEGPTIYLFLLTFQLIIAFAPIRQHLFWLLVHVLFVLLLLLAENYYPDLVPYTYLGKHDRFIDLMTSYTVIIVCMYFVTSYLRNNYNKERKIAENRAATITEQNRLITQQNIQLDMLNSEKDKLLSVIVHDLKTPLDTITATAILLNEPSLANTEKEQLKDEILAMARSAGDMLTNVQSWIYTGNMSPVIEELELTPQFQKVEALYAAMATRKRISCSINTATKLTVAADEHMLQTILRNLISNAIKFTPESGYIYIDAEMAADDKCLITVKDTGIGLSAEQIGHLFDLNIRSSYGTQNEAGLSLGLQLTKKYIDAMEGKIWVNSIEGNGSTFYVLLPAHL